MKVLAIDIGGTRVKLQVQDGPASASFDSSSELTPDQLIPAVQSVADRWHYDAVAIGYPGQLKGGSIVTEPRNLGGGWIAFDFSAAFGRPVRLINDAAMQALGSYDGVDMLFLGLGTGLGSALIVGETLQPLELAHLPCADQTTYEDDLGRRGLAHLGVERWRARVHETVDHLREAFQVEEVVLGGGNVRLLETLPSRTRACNNTHALEGGFRLWEEAPIRTRRRSDRGGSTHQR